MGAIRILDGLVVDRIAAGEVVERPASVIKELVENALDAGATRIAVQLQESGIGLVEVADDGHGMAADDVELAFAQHATSKVRTIEDLDAIGTMGFRGEALASIAAVARVELITSDGEGAGLRVRVEGGVRQGIESLAWPRGTTVRVADLFYNTPARRKSLKKPATELRHSGQTVTDYALGRPDVYISLAHASRTLLAAPQVATLEERVHQVLGSQVAEHWLPVAGRFGALTVSGGITSPEHQRPNRNEIRWYVNGRPVADYRLVHALTAAYESLLDAKRYPVAVIYLQLPVDAVDVNVHPRKAEVRFADANAVYRGVRTAVRETLARHMPPVRIRPREERAPQPASRRLPVPDWIVAEGTGMGATRSRSGASPGDSHSTPGIATEEELTVIGERTAIRGTAGAIRPLAQYDNTYILAADERGLLIIDQHVAHERVLYEQLLAQMRARGVEAQHLLVPETLDLSTAEADLIAAHGELLASVGFELEPFGGNAWAIRTAPAILSGRDLEPTVRALVAALADGDDADALQAARHELAASISCHAAVRANHPLTREEMVRLIADLERCEAPTRCPHGRPILVRIDHEELEKRIGRH